MNKAIDTLESLIEYLENEVRPSCEYYIYSNLIDITDKAIAELQVHKAKIDELKEWCKEERNFWKSKDYASGFNVAVGQTLLKLEELEG